MFSHMINYRIKSLAAPKALRLFSTQINNVPWFPTHVSELDKFSTECLSAGAELESDHPGFHDSSYRERRLDIVKNAKEYKFGNEIPRVKYTNEEVETWAVVYERLRNLCDMYACKEYKAVMPLMEANCGYAQDNIPQLEDISLFLQKTTGFRLRPVSGLLTARDFLNALAFRTFFSTQYIRHHSTPLYTPEPDICHELLGHVPMLADPKFANFSQHIGMASLGATDEDIEKLATCYWFSVEFGLLREGNDLRAYGAGLLSSFGELEYSCTGKADGFEDAEYRDWEPSVACTTEYPITTYQPIYYVAQSLESAEQKMKDYCDNVDRPFNLKYDRLSETVRVVSEEEDVEKSLRERKLSVATVF